MVLVGRVGVLERLGRLLYVIAGNIRGEWGFGRRGTLFFWVLSRLGCIKEVWYTLYI